MKVSVIVNTVRAGGIDILAVGMLSQTLSQKDFEVIIVDGMYEERKPFWQNLPDNFIHIPPDKKSEYYDACACHNTGLRIAKGELVIFLGDYIYAHRSFLSEHYRIYKEYPGYSAVGYCDCYAMPRFKRSNRDSGIDQYYNWDEVALSMFREPFTNEYADRFFSMVEPFYRERRGIGLVSQYTEVPGDVWYGSLNESIPMSVLQTINGWDERYDGAYGVSDIDLGTRANKAGWNFLMIPDFVNCRFGNRSIGSAIPGNYKPNRVDQDNMKMYLASKDQPEYKAIKGTW